MRVSDCGRVPGWVPGAGMGARYRDPFPGPPSAARGRACSVPQFPQSGLRSASGRCTGSGVALMSPPPLPSLLPRVHARPLVRHHPQPPLGLGAGHPDLRHREAAVLGGAECPRGRPHPRHHGLVRRWPLGQGWGGCLRAGVGVRPVLTPCPHSACRESSAAAQRGVRLHYPGHQQPPLRLHQGHFRLPGEHRAVPGTPPACLTPRAAVTL